MTRIRSGWLEHPFISPANVSLGRLVFSILTNDESGTSAQVSRTRDSVVGRLGWEACQQTC